MGGVRPRPLSGTTPSSARDREAGFPVLLGRHTHGRALAIAGEPRHGRSGAVDGVPDGLRNSRFTRLVLHGFETSPKPAAVAPIPYPLLCVA